MSLRDDTQKELEETREELRRASLVRELLEHGGWAIIEADFMELVEGLDTIREANLKEKGIEELMARQIAIGILEEWLERQKDRPGQISDLTKSADALSHRLATLGEGEPQKSD